MPDARRAGGYSPASRPNLPQRAVIEGPPAQFDLDARGRISRRAATKTRCGRPPRCAASAAARAPTPARRAIASTSWTKAVRRAEPRAQLGRLPVRHVHRCTPRATIRAATRRSGNGNASTTSSRCIPRSSARFSAPAAETARAIARPASACLPVLKTIAVGYNEREHLSARPHGSDPGAAADGRREVGAHSPSATSNWPRRFPFASASSASSPPSVPASRRSTSAPVPTGTTSSSSASAAPAA